MTDPTPSSETSLRVTALARARGASFALRPDADTRDRIAAALGLSSLRKLSFTGRVTPEGKADWELDAMLGATVVQPCSVTLAPVTTRIDEAVRRRFVADPTPQPEAAEVEMPEDDSVEPLGTEIDLVAVMTEALSLAVPAYPRAPDADLGEIRAAPPGAEPLDEADLKPFAALKALWNGTPDEDGSP